MTNLEKKLKEIIINLSIKSIGENDITDTTNLISDLDFDSVQLVELIINLELSFNIELDESDMDIDKLNNFMELKSLIIEKAN